MLVLRPMAEVVGVASGAPGEEVGEAVRGDRCTRMDEGDRGILRMAVEEVRGGTRVDRGEEVREGGEGVRKGGEVLGWTEGRR